MPASVKGWFESGEPEPTHEGQRIDHYLLPEGNGEHMKGLGIKLREGRLEIKQRSRSLGETGLGKTATGIVESWRKWSFVLERGQEAIRGVSLENLWLAVEKKRTLRRYNVDDRGRVKPADRSTLTPDCEMELSVVRAAGEMWWSLALEAVGQERKGLALLTRVARGALGSTGAPILSSADSRGYPVWLQDLKSASV